MMSAQAIYRSPTKDAHKVTDFVYLNDGGFQLQNDGAIDLGQGYSIQWLDNKTVEEAAVLQSRDYKTFIGRETKGKDTWQSDPNIVNGIQKALKKVNIEPKKPSSSWGYSNNDGPDTWCECYPIANGKRQSPIDIVPKHAIFDSELRARPFQTTYKAETDVDVANTGASVKVQITQHSGLSGGPLEGQYRLEQFHLHWGSTNDRGSEHTVNDRMYAAELHLVHWNAAKYSSFSEAADKPDGLAVLGYFVDIGKEHQGFKAITDQLRSISDTGSNVKAPGQFDPTCLLKGDLSRYWTYLGSLTTPPLYESVTWIVFDDVMEISQAQMDALRSIKNSSDCCIMDNYRPPVPLCDRTVRASFSDAAILS